MQTKGLNWVSVISCFCPSTGYYTRSTQSNGLKPEAQQKQEVVLIQRNSLVCKLLMYEHICKRGKMEKLAFGLTSLGFTNSSSKTLSRSSSSKSIISGSDLLCFGPAVEYTFMKLLGRILRRLNLALPPRLPIMRSSMSLNRRSGWYALFPW